MVVTTESRHSGIIVREESGTARLRRQNVGEAIGKSWRILTADRGPGSFIQAPVWFLGSATIIRRRLLRLNMEEAGAQDGDPSAPGELSGHRLNCSGWKDEG
ncbi:hypothetical protein OIDMADRAFT_32642 [Oidiodendron maius Zn]|uniref:Uncharacterized protein n=1 Tax=Oidiodendron maius (strain Zn) TaxID=913774 RepID=A0A0C3H000_OIDMZ|nr:hypothetical protein OIDMADRAFT_32642 [Oidiodendron maius Zn]